VTKRWLVTCGAALVFSCGPMGPEPTDAGTMTMSDAGRPADGGVGGMDAGTTMDAGSTVDAGMMVDAGMTMDAGVQGGDGGVRFSADVAPALGVCLGCHPDRNTYADVRARVTPGDPSMSRLYQRITSQARPMPPSGPLSGSDPQGTANIEAWIRAGALDN
jgi:hypothetical protein